MGKSAVSPHLLVRGSINDTGGGTLQYTFQLNVVHPRGRFFTFIQYTTYLQREKANPDNSRKHIATELRRKRANLWHRYHEWKATHFP